MNDSTVQNFLTLFSCCKVVKGYNRSTILDLQTQKIYIIPNSLGEFINKCKNSPYEEVLNCYNKEDKKTIKSYIDYLTNNNFCFFTETPDKFPDISTEWDHPSKITNAIIDISSHVHDFLYLNKQLSKLGCYSVEIRVFNKHDFSVYEKIIAGFNNSRIKQIILHIPYQVNLASSEIFDPLFFNQRLKAIYVHSLTKNIAEYSKNSVIYKHEKLIDASCCGKISRNNFLANIDFYTESINHNNCLNRKISIDADGNIKNCPAMKASFGYYKKYDFNDIISTDKFQSNWDTTKDKISACADCEFRYSCLNCQIITSDKNNMYSKPKHCGYDPYTSTWR
ncbi:grasp-with-spasm system SPASM domain peptide maturase [Spartinivicinus poritis]|uniref:Grasp-with-spasm system SPASM domain peptide maturase n=1 Tax=Spartinivicinus poritis TaxID=2994640 RepID=A0ABT5UJ17_9GAMM|nr:grasp-with-spasm system SPASM domain peptide maturase [Spartinivicinus sp. A2-2]MDE1465044.1 grasp-with-spasm system SPASM domain peptide maturase [Spartinivicinus sp. A2-2]